MDRGRIEFGGCQKYLIPSPDTSISMLFYSNISVECSTTEPSVRYPRRDLNPGYKLFPSFFN